jgi:hypothetical protein
LKGSNVDLSNIAQFEELIQPVAAIKPQLVNIFKGGFLKEKGAALLSQKQHAAAREALVDAIRLTLGLDTAFVLPIERGTHDSYFSMTTYQFIDVISCANLITQSYIYERMYFQVSRCMSHS